MYYVKKQIVINMHFLFHFWHKCVLYACVQTYAHQNALKYEKNIFSIFGAWEYGHFYIPLHAYLNLILEFILFSFMFSYPHLGLWQGNSHKPLTIIHRRCLLHA